MPESPDQPRPDSPDPPSTDPPEIEPDEEEEEETGGGRTVRQSEFSGSRVRVPEKVDQGQIAHFVTTIKNAEQQVGEHIIRALQHEDTVAVLTTVAMTPDGQQRVISAALDPDRLQQVQEILQAAEQEREPEEPCIGFHCLVKRKPIPGINP